VFALYCSKQKFGVPHHGLPNSLIPEKPTQSSKGYFEDKEEGMAFVLSIAFELDRRRSLQWIWRNIFPKIKWHFHDENDAVVFFKRCIEKARKLVPKNA